MFSLIALLWPIDGRAKNSPSTTTSPTMPALLLILLSLTSLSLGLWGMYRDLAMPLGEGGLACLCGIYMTTTCWYALPPLLDTVLKFLFGAALCVRTHDGWIWSRRLLTGMILLQAIMIPVGISYQMRLLIQADQPLELLIMPAVVLSVMQLLIMGLGSLVWIYLGTTRVKNRFGAGPSTTPRLMVPGANSASPAR